MSYKERGIETSSRYSDCGFLQENIEDFSSRKHLSVRYEPLVQYECRSSGDSVEALQPPCQRLSIVSSNGIACFVVHYNLR